MFTGDYICTSYKRQLMLAAHNHTTSTGHTFKIALFDANASLNADTSNYTTANEVVGTNYSAGGIILGNITPAEDGTVGFSSFGNAIFANVTLTTRGAIIYNSTYNGIGGGTTHAVAVLDFGSNKSPVANNLTITFPTADGETAIIRIT